MKNFTSLLKIYKNIGLILSVILLSLATNRLCAQSVNITVNVIPPYSPYYADYAGANAGKVLLVVQNLTPRTLTVKLTGQLEGDNGIKISTKPNYVPLQPLVLNPNETKQLNGLSIKDIFDLNNLNVSGIDKTRLIVSSRLPEGNYSFCIQAVDVNSNQVLSSMAPLGCTAIAIAYPDAPVPVSPAANFNVLATTPQSVVFNWINAGFTPVGTQYLLQVAEMPLNNADPNQVLNSTSFPLVNKTVSSLSYVLSPSDPPLKVGKRYAWRVKAIDPTGKTTFKNDGVSQAFQFRYGEEIKVASILTLDLPKANQKVDDASKLVFSWSFKDNSAGNDPVSLGGLSSVPNLGFNTGLFKLHITRVKTAQELAKEKTDKLANAKSKVLPAEEIVVNVNAKNISYKNSAVIADFIKDQNHYEWYVEHPATGTKSGTQNFVVQYAKAAADYSIQLVGRLKYRYYDDLGAYNLKTLQRASNPNLTYTEAEAGYVLGKTNIQALRIKLLVPVYRTKHSVKVIENGQPKVYTEEVDSIPTLTDLRKTYIAQVKVASVTPIAAGQTDDMGNFDLKVPVSKHNFNVIDSNVYTKGSSARKALVEGIVVQVNDTRFSDPNWFIYPTPNKTSVALNEDVVQIYDYKLNVSFNTKVQRNYKGKMYVLKAEKNLVKGEVDNLVGQTKEVLTISKSIYNFPGNKQKYNYGHSTYSVVGSSSVTGEVNANATLAVNFKRLVSEINGTTAPYLVYFEPDDEQNALYFSPENVANSNKKTVGFESTVFKASNVTENVILGPKYLNMTISGRYLYKWKEAYGKVNTPLPLPEGTKLTLVKGYLTTKSLIDDKGSDLLEQKKVATTTVGKNGDYQFDLGLLNYDAFNADGGKNMVILVDDPYYASEPTFIAYNQNENIQLPDMTAVVRQFKFTSRLMYKKDGVPTPATFMQVYLCRLKNVKPKTIPVNEGDPNSKDYFKNTYKNIDGKEYDILDKTTLADGGVFTFNRLVLPSEDPSDQYFILAEPNSTSNDNYLTEEAFPLTGVMKFWSIFTLGSFGQQTFADATQVLDSKYVGNGQYVTVVPQKPYIDGAVYPFSNTATSVLSGVKVELFNMSNLDIPANSTYEAFEKYFNTKQPIDVQITGTNGRFLFDDFYDNIANRTKGKMLRLTKAGFITTYKPIEGGIPITKGRRANLGKVYLDLPIELNAIVVDNYGKGVPARIVVGDDFSWADTYKTGQTSMAYLKSPKGKVKFTVIPGDLATYKTTVSELTIDPKKSTNITLVVNSNMHSIGVTVVDKISQKSVPANVYITNIKETPGIEKFMSNGNVVNVLEFASSGSQFDIKVVPTGNFTIAKTQVKSDMTKAVNVTVYVEPAVTLTCFASTMNGSRKTDLNDYHMVIDGLDEDEYIFTKRSVALGSTLSKIPANRWLTIGATQKGYIGQDQAVLTNSPKTLYFKFTDASDFPVDNLYGFPIELTGLGKLNDGSYLASGRLNPQGKAGASNLTLESNDQWLRFKDVKIKVAEELINGQRTAGKPKVTILSDIIFDENELDAKLFNKISVAIRDNAGLSLQGSGNTGSIMGRVSLDPSSLSAGVFSNVAGTQGEGNYLYLNKMDTEYIPSGAIGNATKANILHTFSTGTSDVTGDNLLVSTLSRRRPIFYMVDDFTVKPDDKVLVSSYGITAKATVATNLSNVADKDAALKGTFNIGYNTVWFTNQSPLKIKLRDWQLEFNTWYLSKAGFTGEGNLNALGLSIPFTKLKMTPKAIGFGNFDVKELTLLNKFPVKINANEVMTSFGFDKGYSAEKGAWSVAILANTQSSSLASLSGLPDLNPSDKILINNINLYDTGDPNDTRILLTENQPAVTLNGISSFKPYSVFGDLLSIVFRGNLDMNIPNLNGLGNVVYDLKYKVINNQFVHVHDTPFKNLNLDANGIRVDFLPDGQEFTNGKLKLIGNLKDKDPSSLYKINVQLDKDLKQIRLHIPENTPTPQRVYLSGNLQDKNYLDNVAGEMKLNNNVWNNFTFSGDMAGSDGVNAADSKVNFTIKGDIVANDSKIGVQNMDAAGMKGINFTYDFKEKALVGSASMQQNTDFADLTMDIDLKVTSSKWYIFSNCLANNIKNTPFNQAAAGIMLGDADLTPEQLASLHKHFKDNDIPANFDNNFKSVKGILMVMSTDIPIPIIPTFDINLDPVAHASLTHGIYGNLYYNAGFSLKKEDLSLAIGARLGAFLKLGVGASIGLACVGINLHADVHSDVSGKLVPFAPAGQRLLLDAGIKFTLQGSAYVGGGVCDSDCETPCVDAGFFDVCSPIPCFKKSLDKTLVLGLSAEVTDAKPYFHFKGLSEL